MSKKKPSVKQKKALESLVANGGHVSKAMREAGYSEATIHTPQKLTESKTWLELVEEYLPDDLLNKKLKEGLDANKQLAARVVFKKEAPTSQSAGELPLANSSTDDFIEVPDFAVRHKYVETALKVKGKLTNNIDIKSDGEKIEPMQIVIIESKKPE